MSRVSGRDGGFELRHAVVHRDRAGAADGEGHQQEQHEGGELQRLAAAHEAFPAVHEQRAGEDRDLHPGGDAGEQADRKHETADEMGEGDVVQQEHRDDPRKLLLLQQRRHELGAGVGDDEDDDSELRDEDSTSICGHSFANMAGALALSHPNISSSSLRFCLREGIASATFIFTAICISIVYPVTSAFSIIVSCIDSFSSRSAAEVIIVFSIVFTIDSGGDAIGSLAFSCVGVPPNLVISCRSLSCCSIVSSK